MTLAVATKIGPYEILSPLGAGGMGEVYRARDTRLDRAVALKVLPAEFARDADRLKRFEQEARATSVLNHPNILTIYDIGQHEGAPFIVAELLDGAELRAQLSNGALPVRRVLDYAQQIAQGLAAAHEKGVVHRDLKPENLFVTKDGRVKILDFGLAKLKPQQFSLGVDSEAPTQKPLTNPGVVLGTVGYMSPEQVRGQEADQRADLFSFGVILYEMLAGQQAFQGESFAETLAAIVKEEPPDLLEVNSKVPPQFERLVRRCLEKHPERRFQTASDLGFALESLAGAANTSQPAAAVSRAPVKRRRSILLAGFGFALLVVGAVIGIFAGKAFWRTPQPTYQRLTFSRGTVWNARFASDGQTVFYSARWNGQPLEVFAVRAGKTEARALKLENTDLLAISATDELAVLRNRQYFGWWFVGRGTLAHLPVDGGAARDLFEDVQEADWSPDGSKLAVVRWVKGRNRLEYPVGKVLYEAAGYISHPRVSPKGDRVAFMDHPAQGDNRGWVAVVDGAGKKTVLSRGWAAEEGLAWSAAGDEVWFTARLAGEAYALYAVTLSGQERLILRTTASVMLHDISRDGQVLLANLNDSINIVVQPPGETTERDLSWLNQGRLTALSPDGKTILFGYWGEGAGINYAVYLRQTDGSPAVRLGDGARPRLSPDGKWVLAVLNTPPQLALLPTGAGEARHLERGSIEQYSAGARWFPDGKRVVFQGREAGRDWRCYLQSIEGGAPRPITPEGTTGSSGEVFVSPDGRFVIASDAQQQRSFYPVAGGTPQPIPPLERGDEIIGWSSDEKSLYLARTLEMPIRVYRFDPVAGRKELLKEVIPSDPAGVFRPNAFYITPDGKGYAYSVSRYFSDLYLVKGLK
jgi:eukaryotic-like serine/threonine-protein kinase